MKQKALHDFANHDYRLFGKLLVRLNFVRTWSAKRTLAYYKVIRSLVNPMQEEMYDGAYQKDETLPMVPCNRLSYPGLKPGTMVHQYRYKRWLKLPYDNEQHTQTVSDFEELLRYFNALNWILDHMENIPSSEKRSKAKTQRINKYGKNIAW